MYSVGRNGPSTSSWTPHFRTRRSDVVPVPLPTPSYVDAYAFNDLHKAVTTLEEIQRIARRVFGGAHPLTEGIDISLRNARAALHARETVETP